MFVVCDFHWNVRWICRSGPFIFYEGGGGAGGIWEAPVKNGISPLSFHMSPPVAVIFLGDSPLQNKSLLDDQNCNFFKNILYCFSTSRYCAHYEDNIYNPYTTELLIKKHKSISDLLIMIRTERVALGLSSTSSSSELMNARMTSLESSSSIRVNGKLIIVSICRVVILCQCLRGLFCCTR